MKYACKEINNENEDSELFEDFKNFYTLRNKDGSTLIKDKINLQVNNLVFGAKKENLSESFAKIWDNKDKFVAEEWKQAMLSECEKLKKIYVDNLADKNFNIYCTSNK